MVEGLVELAIAKAFGRDVQAIRQAMLLSGDIAQVALLAKKDALSTAIMKPLAPLSFMLADVMFSAEEIERYYNKQLICEFKYDGIRVQLHKFDDKVKMFSRKLEHVASSFPGDRICCIFVCLQNLFWMAKCLPTKVVGRFISKSCKRG